MQLLIATALADGAVDAREEVYIRSFMNLLGLTPDEVKAMWKQKSQVSISALPSDRDGRLALLTDVIVVALADGAIVAAERKLIERVGRGLGASQDDLRACEERAQREIAASDPAPERTPQKRSSRSASRAMTATAAAPGPQPAKVDTRPSETRAAPASSNSTQLERIATWLDSSDFAKVCQMRDALCRRGEEALPHVIALLADPRLSVFEGANWVLRRIGTAESAPSALPVLVESLRRAGPDRRCEAKLTLLQFGQHESVTSKRVMAVELAPLRSLLTRTQDEDLRDALAEVLLKALPRCAERNEVVRIVLGPRTVAMFHIYRLCDGLRVLEAMAAEAPEGRLKPEDRQLISDLLVCAANTRPGVPHRESMPALVSGRFEDVLRSLCG